MRRIAWLIIPIVIVALLAVAAFAVRAPHGTTAFTLGAGDCFDIPADAQVGDISTLSCDGPHDAQAFVAITLASAPTAAEASGDSGSAGSRPAPYPGTDGVAQFVAGNCDAATLDAWLGRPATADLVVGYFFPSEGAWNLGERRVTCYVHTSDGAKLTGSLAAAG